MLMGVRVRTCSRSHGCRLELSGREDRRVVLVTVVTVGGMLVVVFDDDVAGGC